MFTDIRIQNAMNRFCFMLILWYPDALQTCDFPYFHKADSDGSGDLDFEEFMINRGTSVAHGEISTTEAITQRQADKSAKCMWCWICSDVQNSLVKGQLPTVRVPSAVMVMSLQLLVLKPALHGIRL